MPGPAVKLAKPVPPGLGSLYGVLISRTYRMPENKTRPPCNRLPSLLEEDGFYCREWKPDPDKP